jgi:hypothetical protein
VKRDNWSLLYNIAGISAILSVAIIPMQIVFFIINPPPETANGFFRTCSVRSLLSN